MPYDVEYLDLYQNYDPDGSDIKKAMDKLIGQQKMIQSTIMDHRQRSENEIEYAMSQITQTADEIRSEVYLRIEDGEGELVSLFQSEISQTASQILQQVSGIETALDGKIQANTSKITQTAGEIRSEVTSAITSTEGRIEEAYSSLVSQTAGEIRSEVSSIETGLDGRITANTSSITQLAESIELKVGVDDYKAGVIASMLKLDSEAMDLISEHINLAGKVTFKTLDQHVAEKLGEIDDKVDYGGVTTIVGGYITTGTLEIANNIKMYGNLGGKFEFKNGTFIEAHGLNMKYESGQHTFSGQVYLPRTGTYMGEPGNATQLKPPPSSTNSSGSHSHGGDTGSAGGHNHGITNGTKLAVHGGGYVTWSSVGSHSHSISSDGSHSHSL